MYYLCFTWTVNASSLKTKHDSDYRNMRTTCLVITTKSHWSVCDKRRYTSAFLIWLVQQLFTVICTQIRYNTIWDAILMCAQKPTWVSLIYRMVHAVHNTAWNTHTHGFCWSKRQWVAVASAGPHASLHLAPDRQTRQHPTTLFTSWMTFLPPNQQHQSTEGNTAWTSSG